jgi:hypothetical protein
MTFARLMYESAKSRSAFYENVLPQLELELSYLEKAVLTLSLSEPKKLFEIFKKQSAASRNSAPV